MWFAEKGIAFDAADSDFFRKMFTRQSFQPPTPTDLKEKYLPAAEVLKPTPFQYILIFLSKETIKTELREMLKQVRSAAYTSDGWSDPRTRRIVSVTIHWV